MKKIIFGTVFLLSAIVSYAQVQINNITVKRNAEKADISFEVEVSRKSVPGDDKLTLTPIVYDGARSVELPAIIVKGRRKRIIDERNRVRLPKDAVEAETGRTIYYTARVEFEEWFLGANIRMERVKENCCTESSLPALVIAQNIEFANADRLPMRIGGMIVMLERNAPLPQNYDHSKTSAQAEMTHLDQITVDFRKGSSRMDISLADNYRSLNALIAVLRSPEDMQKGKIEITGYASPEGQQQANYNLAQNRALAVRNYILDNVPHLRPADFNIINGGENWEGLRRLVEASRMPDRWQVLDIIDTTPAEINYVTNTSRKKTLMDLNGGHTWNYMLQNLFPELRNAASVAVYKTVSKSQSAGAELPAQNTEIINQAIDQIGVRNTSAAISMLIPISDDPRAWNPLGVAYLLENNIDKAKEYFTKAVAVGYSQAEVNLKQLK